MAIGKREVGCVAEFEILTGKVKTQVYTLQQLEKSLGNVSIELSAIKRNIPSNSGSSATIRQSFKTREQELQRESENLKILRKKLQGIQDTYEQTDNNISKDYQKSTMMDDFKSDLKSNAISEVISSTLESSGGIAAWIAGRVNVATSPLRSSGENAFVILNPNVAQKTASWIKGGNMLATGAKYGLPVLGGVIDFVSMKSKGEETVDAITKAVVHTGIGIGIGIGVGMAIGSVIPFAGTAIGAVIGFGAGVALTTIGNMTFDYVYDNWDSITSDVKQVSDYVMNKANDLAEGNGNIFDSIGNAMQGSFSY